MPIGVKGLELDNFAGSAHHSGYSIDRKDVESLFTAGIRNNAIFVAFLLDQHRLGDLFKQIDDGTAAELERLLRKTFEHLSSLGPFEIRDQEYEFDLVAEIG